MRITSGIVRIHLKKVLSSQSFKEADRLKQFLQYMVLETLSGRAGCLKEFQLAVDVFDKPASFDPRLDPIVRVQAGRLRAKLKDYYGIEGSDDVVQIHVPRGSYIPLFTSTQNHESSWPSFDPAFMLFYVGIAMALDAAESGRETLLT